MNQKIEKMKDKLLIAVVCTIVGFLWGWMINSWRLSSSYQSEKADVVQANADHFADASKQINESAKDYVGKSERLEKQITELKKELAHAKKNRPLPVECRPDPDWLRVLAEAVHTANRAAAGH